MSLIDFQNVSKTFEKNGERVEALREVSLSVPEGRFVALIGPSGCGKSTLLNIAAGLMAADQGTTLYRQNPVTSVNTQVGYMTQSDNLLPWRTTAGNVQLALEIRKVRSELRREKVADVLDLVGLSGFEKHYPRELSGGMKKRVALARTLIYEPETLLLDEPFGALDAQLRLILQQELLDIWGKLSATILFVTHQVEEAIGLADEVVVFSRRPARIRLHEEVGLPRPRDIADIQFTSRFRELYGRIWSILSEDIRAGSEA